MGRRMTAGAPGSLRSLAAAALLVVAATAGPASCGMPATLRYFPNVRSFGQFGTEPGEFRTPTGVALSPDGFLYVTDHKNNSVLRFDDDGRFVGQILPGDVPFDAPVAVAFDSRRNFYVVEERGCRVRKFDARGSALATYGGVGSEPGKFRGPRGVAVDARNQIFVADYDNHRIQEFDANFTWVRNIRMKDSGRRPASPRGLAIDRQNRLWACFSNIHKVVRFDAAGNPDLVVGSEGTGLGQFEEPRYLAFDYQNDFFVTDYRNGRIQRFDARGEFVFTVGTKGIGRSQFRGPQGIAVDLKGNVYVADSENFRVQVMMINDLLGEINHAAHLFDTHEYEKSLALYQKILSKVPLHLDSQRRVVAICEILAERAQKAGQLDRAKPYLEEILRLQPSNVKAIQFSRWILWRTNKGMIYYLTLGTGIFFTFMFLVTTMVKILTSD
jgi:sugar lactone lactonase YvrE